MSLIKPPTFLRKEKEGLDNPPRSDRLFLQYGTYRIRTDEPSGCKPDALPTELMPLK